jgi:hypothetical protein
MIINVNPYGRFEDLKRVMDFSLTANAVRVRPQAVRQLQRTPLLAPPQNTNQSLTGMTMTTCIGRGQPTPRALVRPPSPEPEPMEEDAPDTFVVDRADAELGHADADEEEENNPPAAGSAVGYVPSARKDARQDNVDDHGRHDDDDDDDEDDDDVWDGDVDMLVRRVKRLREEVRARSRAARCDSVAPGLTVGCVWGTALPLTEREDRGRSGPRRGSGACVGAPGGERGRAM